VLLTLTKKCPLPKCPNYSCPRRVYGRVHKYVFNLDIKGVGDETLLQLCDLGLVKTPADLYKLTLQQYTQVEGRGKKAYEKLAAGLMARLEMSTAEFFASLDIEGNGTWEAITAVQGLGYVTDVLKVAYSAGESEAHARLAVAHFAKAARVSVEKAEAIVLEINTRRDEIAGLLDIVKIKKPGVLLAGKSFCITGSLSMPRTEIERMIKEAGGTVASGVSKNTTFLVTNDPTDSSSKLKKAKDLGMTVENGKIIDEAKLLQLLGHGIEAK
jgi:DNA ligase (NAD+)